MPNEIINRANEILKTYESNSNKKKEGGEEQLFFALPVKDELREYLKTIDPLNITPIEALKILVELKEKN
jgi:DNA mismatch repair ATPase MutS